MSTRSSLPHVQLIAGRDRALRGGHPWVLSGSIAKVAGDPAPGDLIRVLAEDGTPLGIGDYDPASQIRVRMLAGGADLDDEPADWLERQLDAAIDARQTNPSLQATDAVRLVHAEADGLPGLTVDRYADWVVIKPSTPGMLRRAERAAEHIAAALGLSGVWLRGEVRGSDRPPDRALRGQVPEEPIQIHEQGRTYHVDLRRGQKTGFYLDQRDARALFQDLAAGRRALDLYAYTGGFSVAAHAGGAEHVCAVESSAPARGLLERNAPGTEIVADDVGHFLQTDSRRFGLIAIDPPPFARHKRDVEAACRAYRELHLRAFARAEAGAHVLTFTCSHHVDASLFRRTVATAARTARRSVQLLRVLTAPPDHPVALSHPEGEYLAGLWLRVR